MIRQVKTLSYDADERDELVLIQQALTNAEHFAPLYERYVDRIYHFCARRVNDPQTAEDLCSQVFVQAIKSLPNFNPSLGTFSAWLYAIARNSVAGYYRKYRTVVPIDAFDFADERDTPIEDLFDFDADKRLLNELVHALPQDKRTLLLLVLNTELTSEDVGQRLNKSANAVRVEFHRIVKSLRQQYLLRIGGTL
ncbi:MAG: sigma-70 family RNA polymerase sigma factor [Aggregatilineales bacterium]